MVAERFPWIRLIRAGGNLGFAKANNVGIRATTGEFVLLLNPDTLVGPDALDRLVGRLEEHPEAAIAGPRIVDSEGHPELSFGSMPSPFTEARQKLIGALYDRGFGPAVRWVERATRQEQMVDWVSGACLLVRRPDAEAVQLLDERYFLYWEDVDCCTVIRNRGRLVLFTPAAEIIHLRGRSAAGHRSAVNQAYRKGQLAFYEKHRPGWLPFVRSYLARRRRLPR
jgi:GT2 family glycosyltransferase